MIDMRTSTVNLELDWRSRDRKVFKTLHELSLDDQAILGKALFDQSGVGRKWLDAQFPEVTRCLEESTGNSGRKGAEAVYRFLEIVDEVGHIDPDICPRQASLCELADLLLQGTDGSSVPEVLLAPFLLATLKLALGTVGVTVELEDPESGMYNRRVKRRNRSGGRMAFPMLFPQKWERAGSDRFIDFTIKVYDANSLHLADRVDVELQSRKHHGELFRSPRYSDIETDSKEFLTESDLQKYLALAELPWPVDPVLIPCGNVIRDPLAVAVDVMRHLAFRCSERWEAAIAKLAES